MSDWDGFNPSLGTFRRSLAIVRANMTMAARCAVGPEADDYRRRLHRAAFFIDQADACLTEAPPQRRP